MTDQAAIIAAAGRPREPFDLNGTKIHLQSLAFADYEPWLKGGEVEVSTDAVTKLLARAIVDEDGARIFADKDAKLIGDMDPRAVMGMFNKVMELSSLTVEAQEDVKADFADARSDEPSTG